MTDKISRTTSPTLTISIAPDQYDRAVQSSSGACLVADAIKAQYPHLSAVSVDMATIRVTDRKRGLRFTYLTPPEAQNVLLSFDQGWSNPFDEITVRRAVKINVVTRTKKGKDGIEQTRQRREEKLALLEAKEAAGETMTRSERSSLAQLRRPYTPTERPTSQPPVDIVENGGNSIPTVVGGQPIIQGAPHPNLLRGRNRHFGAKVAAPGLQWTKAVEQAAADLLAQRAASDDTSA